MYITVLTDSELHLLTNTIIANNGIAHLVATLYLKYCIGKMCYISLCVTCCSEDKIIALYKQLSGLGRGYAIVKYVSLLCSFITAL